MILNYNKINLVSPQNSQIVKCSVGVWYDLHPWWRRNSVIYKRIILTLSLVQIFSVSENAGVIEGCPTVWCLHSVIRGVKVHFLSHCSHATLWHLRFCSLTRREHFQTIGLFYFFFVTTMGSLFIELFFPLSRFFLPVINYIMCCKDHGKTWNSVPFGVWSWTDR